MRLERDVEIKNILKMMCPGTQLREGLENILRAKTGGLIVLGDSEEVMKIVDGGFTIHSSKTGKSNCYRSMDQCNCLIRREIMRHSLQEWLP